MTAKPRHARTLLTLMAPFVLTGCAMPVPVTIASFVLDGLSIATTNKTVTDHGLSFVAQQDCAVWRGFTEGELCREDDADSDVITALNEEMGGDDEMNELANMETAAGSDGLTEEVAELSETPAPTLAPLTPEKVEAVPLPPLEDQRDTPAEVDTAWYAPKPVMPDGASAPQALPPMPPQAPEVPETLDPGNETLVAPEETEETRVAREPTKTPSAVPARIQEKPKPTVTKHTVAPAEPKRNPVHKATPASGGFHYVIASFAKTGYAERLIKKNAKLGARVAKATVGSKTYYRVVVGPLPAKDRRATRRTLARAGFKDAWGVRIDEAAVEVASAN